MRRVQCVHCGNREPRTLHYLYPDDPDDEQAQWSIQVCDRCKGYLRLAASLEPTPVVLLPIQDLEMHHLDIIAREEGYGFGPPGQVSMTLPSVFQ
jgi:FdhE protein